MAAITLIKKEHSHQFISALLVSVNKVVLRALIYSCCIHALILINSQLWGRELYKKYENFDEQILERLGWFNNKDCFSLLKLCCTER